MSFWQENLPFIKGFFDERSTKFLELMDNAEKSIEQVTAPTIYTSKQFQRIKDNFDNIVKNLERQEVRDWLQNTREILEGEKKASSGDDKLTKIFSRFEELTPKVNDTKLITDSLWKAYEYTDDLVPLMEFTNEQLGAANREIFTGSVSATEDIIEKHLKVMDKIDKKKNDVKAIIAKGEKLESMPKAPAFLGEKLREMKALWENTTTTAKKRLDDLRNNAGNWNTFAEKCQTLQTQVTTAQKQIDDVKKVLADDDTKCQLNQEVEDLREAIKVMGALDDKLVWLDEFNKNIIDYDKICTELEGIVKKDRADLDNLIKPPTPLKSTDRLVQAMDLADDIRAQEEISTAKQDLWNQGLAPEGKENTDEAKAFVKRMTDVATTLAALIKEADGEAAKYGQDIVLLAAFTNAQKNFEGWIEGAEKKIEQGYPSPNNMEEATTMVNNCKEWMDQTTALGAALELGKANADKMTLHADQDALYTSMKARWVKVDEAAKEWTKKLAELSGMWSKQTEMLNKVTSTMVDGGGAGKGEQVNLNELDQQMEQIKEMFVKKQEMMKKMSSATAPDPAQLAA